LVLFFKKDLLAFLARHHRTTMLFPRWLRVLLLLLTAIRLGVAARAPLSADEAYYWIWSKALAPGYLDHPPMVALWIKAGTMIAGDTLLGVRLLGPISALLGSLLLMSAARDFAPASRAGPRAACLLNATLVLNVGAVVMTPDTPLLFFWTAALAACGKLINTRRPGWWLVIGLLVGLALDSKYTAVLLGASLAAWVLLVPTARTWLRHWQLWAGAILAAACFAPVIWWNAAHGFVSFLKQGGRGGDWHPAQSLRYLAELLAGQAGLATPWVAILLVTGIMFAVRGLLRRDERLGLLACVTVIPAVVFCEHALGGRVQANWPSVIFPGAVLAAACVPKMRFWLPASALGLLIAVVVFLQAAAAPIALPRWFDFTLIRLAGWSNLAGQVFITQSREKLSFVAADEYGLASGLSFRLRTQVLGIEPRWRYFPALPTQPLAGRTGLLVRSEREYGDPDRHLWSSITSLGTITRQRAGIVAETYRLFRVTGAPATIGTSLPHPKEVEPKLAPD
jgi:4-amino-4-deoxy-L-arabinose transferase-like glycosyltransferase